MATPVSHIDDCFFNWHSAKMRNILGRRRTLRVREMARLQSFSGNELLRKVRINLIEKFCSRHDILCGDDSRSVSSSKNRRTFDHLERNPITHSRRCLFIQTPPFFAKAIGAEIIKAFTSDYPDFKFSDRERQKRKRNDSEHDDQHEPKRRMDVRMS